tara:strand:+ start:96 stop:581 length:486 start_codon:yes stop_codon:yes gene_type:complete
MDSFFISMSIMSISYEEKVKAQQFVEKINSLMETIEEIAPLIPEGKYLKCMDDMKNLYELNKSIKQDPIFSQFVRRAEMPTRRTITLSDAQKLSRGYKICVRCNTIVQNIGEHQQTRKCKTIRRTKGIATKTGVKDTTRIEIAVIAIRKALYSHSKQSKFI